MSDEIIFDHESPVTVHDILWSWSTGYMSTERAVEMLHLEDEAELREAADDNGIPCPAARRPSRNH